MKNKIIDKWEISRKDGGFGQNSINTICGFNSLFTSPIVRKCSYNKYIFGTKNKIKPYLLCGERIQSFQAKCPSSVALESGSRM